MIVLRLLLDIQEYLLIKLWMVHKFHSAFDQSLFFGFAEGALVVILRGLDDCLGADHNLGVARTLQIDIFDNLIDDFVRQARALTTIFTT